MSRSFTGDLKAQGSKLDKIVDGVDTAVASISDVAKKSQGTLSKVDGVLDGVDAETVRTALANIEKASESANKAAGDIAAFTDKLSPRSEDINQIITDAKELAQRLNAASVRVDGILVKVDKLLGFRRGRGLVRRGQRNLEVVSGRLLTR